MKNKVTQLMKYIILFSLVAILIIVNAKFNITLGTHTFPRYKKNYNMDCPSNISNISNISNTSNTSNTSNSIDQNQNKNSVDNINTYTSNTPDTSSNYINSSKYITNSPYNKFYWANN